MTRLLLIATVAVAALGLTACDRDAYRAKRDAEWAAKHAPKTIAKLDCPQTQGQLTLVSAAPDGQSCAYTGKQSEVTLKLVALNGADAKSVLDPLEAELRALIPTKPGAVTSSTNDKDSVDIDLPGVKIKAGDKGANISVAGGPTINADDGGAEIKVRDNVDGDEDAQVGVKADDKDVSIKTGPRKWRHRQKAGVRSLFILATDAPASPYKVVGYDARGPKAGPLAIAIVKAKGDKDGDDDDDIFDDAKALVKHNVGG
jgi:hypothetical protein